jgi:hypothetical protein
VRGSHFPALFDYFNLEGNFVLGIPDQNIRNIVAFLKRECTDPALDRSTVAEQIQLVKNASKERDRELVVKQGCIGCHARIEGVTEIGELGPDLTTFGAVHISFLDFGHLKVPFKDHTVPTWIYYKVKSPRIFKEGLKMPDYYLNEEESEAITTYIFGLKGKELPASYTLPFGERH